MFVLRWAVLVGKRVAYVRDNVMPTRLDVDAILLAVLLDASESVSYALFRGAGDGNDFPMLYDLVSPRFLQYCDWAPM